MRPTAYSSMRKEICASLHDDVDILAVLHGSLLLASVSMVASTSEAAANDEFLSNETEQIRVIEGDILVNTAPDARAIVIPKETHLWPDGIVPYSIDPALSMLEVLVINNAIEHWNEVSGISLKPLDKLDSALYPVTDSVRFVAGDVCASWVGRRGGEQSLWVAPNCNSGSVMHEIGHALGLEHEHTRPDRGNHIDIHWDNIDPGKRHNFDVAPAGSRMLGSYDYDSIMHYGPTTFSINGQSTITPKDRNVSGIGQRVAPSQGDLDGIAELYGSDLSVVAQQFPESGRTDLAIHVTNEVSQGAHDIELTVSSNVDASFLAEPDKHWSCAQNHTTNLICKLDRLPAGGTTVLRLAAEGINENDQLNASVMSKTPDLNLSNNVTNSLTDDPVQVIQERPMLVAASPIQGEAIGKVSLGGAIAPVWLCLLLLLIKRQCRGWVNRVIGILGLRLNRR